MAFVSSRVEELHKQSGEKAIEFSRAIFGQTSKLGPTYFRGKTSISTAHLEKLCLHFHVPMSFFFDGPVITENRVENIVTHNGVGVGNVNISNNLSYLQEVIEQQKSQLSDKDLQIEWLKKQHESLLAALKCVNAANKEE